MEFLQQHHQLMSAPRIFVSSGDFDKLYPALKTVKSKVSKHDDLKKSILDCLDDLYRFALSLSHNSTDAEDLVSETVLKAIENISKLNDKTKMKQWLFRILSHKFIDQRRKSKRFPHLSLEKENNESANFSLYESVSHSSFTENETPESSLMQKFLDENIQQAIMELPEVFRVALVLCDKEEMSYQEIAEMLDVAVGTVRSRIARGRSILQKKLWQQALEMGIRTRTTAPSKEKECTCGEEKTLTSNIEQPILSEK